MRKRGPSVLFRHVLCCSIPPSLVAKSVATVHEQFPAGSTLRLDRLNAHYSAILGYCCRERFEGGGLLNLTP
jgi:hypothetical protein